MRIPPLQAPAVVPRLIAYAVGFGVGAATGAYVTKHILEARFENILNEEVRQTREYYTTLSKRDMPSPTDHPGLADAQKDLYERLVEDKYKGKRSEEAPEEKPPVPSWITEPVPQISEEEEQESRNRAWGTLISEEEFYENEHDWTTVEVSYYAGDEVCVEEPDRVWNSPGEHLGDSWESFLSLLDPEETDIYIRNEINEILYHISLDLGSYADLFAAENELRHAHLRDRRRDKRPRKFRGD